MLRLESILPFPAQSTVLWESVLSVPSVKVDELTTIKRELTQIKHKVDYLLESLDRMEKDHSKKSGTKMRSNIYLCIWISVVELHCADTALYTVKLWLHTTSTSLWKRVGILSLNYFFPPSISLFDSGQKGRVQSQSLGRCLQCRSPTQRRKTVIRGRERGISMTPMKRETC